MSVDAGPPPPPTGPPTGIADLSPVVRRREPGMRVLVRGDVGLREQARCAEQAGEGGFARHAEGFAGQVAGEGAERRLVVFVAESRHDLFVEDLVSVAALVEPRAQALGLDAEAVVPRGAEQRAGAVGVVLETAFAGPRRQRQDGVGIGLEVDVVQREARVGQDGLGQGKRVHAVG